ncbi:MAG: hypothetical protein ACYCRE_00170 [Acidobacteriaceae bacterium]
MKTFSHPHFALADGRALFLGIFLLPKLGGKLVALATTLWIWLP